MRHPGSEYRHVRHLDATNSRMVDLIGVATRGQAHANRLCRDGVAPRLPQHRQHLPKAVKPGLQVLDDLLGELVRLRQVVQIDQALVLEPEDVEAGLVPGRQLLVAVAPPAALGRFPLIPRGLAPVAVARVVALDEPGQVPVALAGVGHERI